MSSDAGAGLAAQYGQQLAWRPWAAIYARLPPLPGSRVLDLGCAIGDQAAELTRRGARVIGIDADEELIRVARSRNMVDAEFRAGDITTIADGLVVDGIWCSFAAAYVPNLAPVLSHWRKHLVAGGWIAVTEIDDMFGHGPLAAGTRQLLHAYADDALHGGRYDFHMGHKLRPFLEETGFHIENELVLLDQELAFDGAASADVVAAWRSRFNRMTRLAHHCGGHFEQVRDDFLDALASPEHRCRARVFCCVATID